MLQQDIVWWSFFVCNSECHADLSEQGKLSKAGALANSGQLILIIIIDGEAALLHHVEHIPCMTDDDVEW